MVAAFEVSSQHGCLVVRDSASDGDVSAWDPAHDAWFVHEGSAIFAVLPGTEGLLRCEVWRDAAAVPLPTRLFTAEFDIRGSLQVEEPSGVVTVDLPALRGSRRLCVSVDDAAWPRHIQVVVT